MIPSNDFDFKVFVLGFQEHDSKFQGFLLCEFWNMIHEKFKFGQIRWNPTKPTIICCIDTFLYNFNKLISISSSKIISISSSKINLMPKYIQQNLKLITITNHYPVN